jgi:hypothetical protein
MQVGELCERLGVPYREVRYVLERGILPRGVEEKPGRGLHRDLNAGQAFWLGLVLVLKQAGVTAPLAREIADYCRMHHRGVAQHEGWDWNFQPFSGKLQTEELWLVEIADGRYMRLATTANPSHQGLYRFPWSEIGKNKAIENVKPVTIITVDLSRLADLLR